jgi:sensor histidine kinase YesM
MPGRLTLRWKVILLGWGLYGAYMSLESILLGAKSGRQVDITFLVFSELAYAAIWMGLTPLVLWLAERFPFSKKQWIRPLWTHLGFSLLVALCHKGIHGIILTLYRVAFEGATFSWSSPYNIMLSYFDYGIQLYWIILLLHHAYAYYARSQQNELKSIQLGKMLVESQLQALKMQLQPHFLFNSLNAIYMLIEKDPKLARSTLRKLSELLRRTLERVGAQEVRLKEELEFLALYLEIEQIRFGERLKVTISVPAALEDARVPNMILQPLVENAVKHGISKIRGEAILEISASQEDGTLELRVFNNGFGIEAEEADSEDTGDPARQGIGLANTRARLERLYGPRQSFKLTELPGGGVAASLTIPYSTATGFTPQDAPDA